MTGAGESLGLNYQVTAWIVAPVAPELSGTAARRLPGSMSSQSARRAGRDSSMAGLRGRPAPLLLVVVVVLLLFSGIADTARLRPDRYCLACLCTAASNCSPDIGCHQRGDTTVCGPFLISADTWRRARLTDPTLADRFPYLGFRECADSAECSEAVLSAYLESTAADCDGDGMISCSDFGVLTVAGPEACGRGPAVLSPDQRAQIGHLHRCQSELAFMLRVPPGDC